MISVDKKSASDIPNGRIHYYCKFCGKLRLGPLAAEANNMHIPCTCGATHWTTKEPSLFD